MKSDGIEKTGFQPPTPVDIKNLLVIKENHERAKILVCLAKQKAEELLRDAIQKAAEIEKNAYDNAYQKGYKEGLAAGRKDGEKAFLDEKRRLLSSLEEKVAFLDTNQKKILESLEPRILNLVLQISRKVIGKELAVNETIVVEKIKKSLKLLSNQSNIILKINPQDREETEKNLEKIFSGIEDPARLEIVEEKRITRGGCILELGSAGYVEALIENQMAEVERIFKDAGSG